MFVKETQAVLWEGDNFLRRTYLVQSIARNAAAGKVAGCP